MPRVDTEPLARVTLAVLLFCSTGCGRLGFPLFEMADGSVSSLDARVLAGDAGPDSGFADSGGMDASGDGGSGDAGMMEAGGLDAGGPTDGGSAPDAGTDGGGSLCASSSSLLACDDFEIGTVSPFSPLNLDGVGAFDTANPFTGLRSYRATTTAAGGYATLEAGLPGAPINSGALYLRTHIYLPAGYSYLWTGIMSLCSQEGGGCVNLALQSSGTLTLQVHRMTANEDLQDPTVVLPLDRWICLSLAIDISETNGSVALAVDGTGVSSLTNIDTVPREGGFNELYIGIPYTVPSQSPVRVVTDDFALATEPLPCP